MSKEYGVRPIGLSGVAQAGKDTFCRLMINELAKDGVRAERFALADELKRDLDAFLIDKFGISSFTTDKDEKTLIRNILVAYGKTHRIRSKGTYWTSKLQKKMEVAIGEGIIPIVTDIRYSYYEYDEVQWIKEGMGGYLIHIGRFMEDGRAVPPANADEKENDPKVHGAADVNLSVPFVSGPDPEQSQHLKVLAANLVKNLETNGIINKTVR